MIKVTFKSTQFATPEARADMAKCVSGYLEGRQHEHFPYMPNEIDSTFWTLDAANDWKIKFWDEHSFEIRHRYNDGKAVKAISTWVAYRLGGTLEDDCQI